MTLRLDCQSGSESVRMEGAVDLHIGRRLRRRRRLLGLTQQELGDGLGLHFQQIQRYECAANRVSASRLHRIAGALNAPLQYFFDGLPNGHGSALESNGHDAVLDEQSLELVRAYLKLPAPVRGKLLEFATALSEGHE